MHIQIVMATQNGARFLREQLDSFVAQEHQDWSLLVSDDRSTDSTRDIVAEFAERVPQEVRLVDGPGKGPAANFLFLLNHPNLGLFPTALSDQDDIWLPDKLSRFVAALGRDDDCEGPLLFSGAAQIIDESGHLLTLFDTRPRTPSFWNALVECIAGGNTMGLNREALRLVRRIGVKIDIPFHDWWLYHLITGVGGRVVYDQVPLLLYRQHDDSYRGANQGWKSRVKRLREFTSGDYRQWVRRNLAALKAIEAELTPEARAAILGLQSRGSLRWLRGGTDRARVYRQKPLETFIIRAALLCGFVI